MVIYPMTESESTLDLEAAATLVGGIIIDETTEFYAAIVLCGETYPEDIEMTNSGTVYAELIGGPHMPSRPK